MKVQFNRAFKGRQALYAIFFNFQYKCAEVRQSPISKPTSSFSVAPLYQRTSQPIVCDYQPISSGLSLRISLLIVLYTLQVLSLSRLIVKFSLKQVYPTIFGRDFQIYDIQFTGKYIC